MSKKVYDRWPPRVKRTKSGKLIVARPHEATFNGRHNASKSKVLIVLYYRGVGSTGLSLKELSEASDVSYSYLESRLGKWVKWDYLIRKIKQGDTRPVYSYSIAARGKHFVENRIPRPRLRDYIAEIREHKG